jgi:hypothetical protein
MAPALAFQAKAYSYPLVYCYPTFAVGFIGIEFDTCPVAGKRGTTKRLSLRNRNELPFETTSKSALCVQGMP